MHLFVSLPPDEIKHYEIQRFRDAGMSQNQFVEELMVNFRYTLYAKKACTSTGTSIDKRALGRLKLEPHFLDTGAIHVIDRAGYLSRSFATMEQLALHRQSTTIEFAHYGLPGQTRFSFIVSPVIAPCLHLLSTYPALQQLHLANRRFAQKERRDFDEVDAKRRLLNILSYFEMLNLVTYEGSHLLADIAWPPLKYDPLSENRNVGPAPVADIKTPAVKTIGGLKVKSRGVGVKAVDQSKNSGSAQSAQQHLRNMGVSEELLHHLRARDHDVLPDKSVREDDIIIELLKIQTAENSLVAQVRGK